MRVTASDIALLEDKAAEAAEFLKLLANPHRLLILCRLVVEKEMSVGALGEAVGLSQSALSQHLAKLRADGLVETRREAQVLHYRISDPRVGRLLAALYEIYCASPEMDSSA
jgi:DNA-binding transcriptional ArsR family regulator